MTHAIRTIGLGKKYILGGSKASYGRLTEVLWERLRRPRSLLRAHAQQPELWALRNVDLEIEEGEVVGVIGPNGAGKTTLLKVLSRITEPTEGRAELYGKVGALLEVGTGFHPELTGRENISLNGAILGMSRSEILGRFDEIVDFAGVEEFLDTPVKHYSSGMFVRLAFSVAAHLQPDVLIVDEVLAVGDAAFQKKSIGKMENVAQEGRTVLLVSHNMGLIREIAKRGIWLDRGELVMDGEISTVISEYLGSARAMSGIVDLSDHPHRLSGMQKIMKRLTVRGEKDDMRLDFSQSETMVLELEYLGSGLQMLGGAGFNITSSGGVRVGGFNTYMAFPPPHRIPQGGRIQFLLPLRQLNPDIYQVSVSVGSHPGAVDDRIDHVASFTVHPADIYGTGHMMTHEYGVVPLEVEVNLDPSQ